MLGTELHVYRRAVGAGGASTKLGDAVGAGLSGGGGMGGGVGGRGRGGLGHRESPQSFALLTSMGIYHGSLALGNQVGGGIKVGGGGGVRYPAMPQQPALLGMTDGVVVEVLVSSEPRRG